MSLHRRMQQYMRIKNLSINEVSDKSGIPLNELETFLDGSNAIDSMDFEKLNSIWPEMVAFTFNIDASICNELHLTRH